MSSHRSANSGPFSPALEAMPVGVLQQEADGRFSLYNAAARKLLGLSQTQLQGLAPVDPGHRISFEDGTPFYQTTWPKPYLSSDEPRTELVISVKRGSAEPRWLLMTSSLLDASASGSQSSAVLTTFTDISEQRKREDDLRQGALYDSLTGLPRQALLLDRLGQVIGKAKRIPKYFFALLVIDLDNFQAVNSTLGRQAGDAVLVAVAEQLKQDLRTADTLARLSDDEFAILLDDAVVLADAVEVAERTLKLFKTHKTGNDNARVGASIGIVMGDKEASGPYQLLNYARDAMQQAKDAGKGRYAVYQRT